MPYYLLEEETAQLSRPRSIGRGSWYAVVQKRVTDAGVRGPCAPACCHCHLERSLQGAGWEVVTLTPEEMSPFCVVGRLLGNKITPRNSKAFELWGCVWRMARRCQAHPGTQPLVVSPSFTVPHLVQK